MGFEQALGQLLKYEGDYSNNSNDNGGETYKGISRNFYPKFQGWTIIDTYTDKSLLDNDKELAKYVSDFYYAFYWYKLRCDDINDAFIAKMLFNFAVNMGKRQVIKKVQRIVGVEVDGLIGNITVAALNNTDSRVFVNHFLLEIIEFYVQISKKGNNKVFLLGWLNRAVSVYYESEQRYK
jgi:lysozyme family protein